jgi:ADP-heptose:LPS heptosyltransferase
MKILFVCSSSLNDIISLNILCTNFIKQYAKETLTLDLISTKKHSISNIFFSRNILHNSYTFEFSKPFFQTIIQLRKVNYTHIIKIGTNLKSELIYYCLKSDKKVRTPFQLANIFKSEKTYQQKNVSAKCAHIFSKIRPFEFVPKLQPEIIFNQNIYAKTHEMVNWFLKSSNKFLLSSYRFCFLYIKSLKETENEQLFNLLDVLIENNICTIPIIHDSEIAFDNYQKKIPSNKQNLLVSNLIQNHDNNHLFLFLKHSEFVITNDQSLKIACEQIEKKLLFYKFDSSKQIRKEEFSLDLRSN